MIDDDTLIEDLEFHKSVRVRLENVLRDNGITTVGQVRYMLDSSFLMMPNFGPKCLAELRKVTKTDKVTVNMDILQNLMNQMTTNPFDKIEFNKTLLGASKDDLIEFIGIMMQIHKEQALVIQRERAIGFGKVYWRSIGGNELANDYHKYAKYKPSDRKLLEDLEPQMRQAASLSDQFESRSQCVKIADEMTLLLRKLNEIK